MMRLSNGRDVKVRRQPDRRCKSHRETIRHRGADQNPADVKKARGRISRLQCWGVVKKQMMERRHDVEPKREDARGSE